VTAPPNYIIIKENYLMKTSFTFILLALLCYSALSAFVAKQSVTLSGATYSIGNKGNDCGVTRTEGGATVSWYYTDGAANSDDCVGQNIFVFGSKIGVLLSVTENQNILIAANSATGGTLNFLVIPPVGKAIVLAYIDTSSASGTFGKFSLGLSDVAVDIDANKAAPIEYVSAAYCDDKKTIQLTVNVQSPYGMLNIPSALAEINGNGVKQVFNSDDNSMTAYKADDAPFCTEIEEPTTTPEKSSAGEDSNRRAWKLALIIGLPSFVLFTALATFLYVKIAAKKAASVKVEKFKQLPNSPTTAIQVGENGERVTHSSLSKDLNYSHSFVVRHHRS